jgi:hypothetical protein
LIFTEYTYVFTGFLRIKLLPFASPTNMSEVRGKKSLCLIMHRVRKNVGITQLTLNLRPEWDMSGQPKVTAALPLEIEPSVPIA